MLTQAKEERRHLQGRADCVTEVTVRQGKKVAPSLHGVTHYLLCLISTDVVQHNPTQQVCSLIAESVVVPQL